MCALCARQGIECRYRDSANTIGAASDRQYLVRLEARLRDVERMLEGLVPQRTQATPTSSRNDVGTGASPWASDASVRPETPHRPREAEVRTYDDSVDGMGSITFANEAYPGSFGKTTSLHICFNLCSS